MTLSPRVLGVCLVLSIAPLTAMTVRSTLSSRAAAARTTWDSVYTTAQASRGETAYEKTCARCHGASLGGGDESPALTGGNFLENWNGLPLSDLQKRIKTTMPSDTVGIYDIQLVTDVIAFMLRANGYPAGAAELPKEAEPLKEIVVNAGNPGSQ